MKRCSENMHQIYCSNFIESNTIEIALWHGCSPVNLLHSFRTLFLKNISEGLLLLKVFVMHGALISSKEFLSSWNMFVQYFNESSFK